VKIIELSLKGIHVDYNDLYVPEVKIDIPFVGDVKKSINYSSENLQKYDATLLITDHDYFDAEFIVENSEKIFDTRGFFPIYEEKVVRV